MNEDIGILDIENNNHSIEDKWSIISIIDLKVINY
jgi:hypothetical protein